MIFSKLLYSTSLIAILAVFMFRQQKHY